MEEVKSEVDLAPLSDILPQFAPQGRTALLPALHAAQAVYGYIPEQVAAEIGKALNVPLVDVFGVVDFYALFYREPVGRTVIHVCGDPACALAGADTVYKVISQNLAHGNGSNGTVTLEKAPCLGLCEHAPALIVNQTQLGRADPSQIYETKRIEGVRPVGVVGRDISILTSRCGFGRPTPLDEYVKSGGYQALQKALTMTPEAIIVEVKASGLVGRGGAAFPTGLKWEGAARASGQPKYVVCNADEAEPGTFKDRVILEEDPHSLLEGMLIAALAIGAHTGYIFIRGEYPQAYRVMTQAVNEAQQAGYLGEDVLASGFAFDVEIRRGAGAYICGEETALFEAIEGKRGFPRVKPPFPTTHGLFGKPTVINNVETLINIPIIIQQGAENYRRIGTEKSPGPKLFCVSGDVQRPGLYEVPFGITLRRLVSDLAGGMRPGRQLKAMLIGGAAGAFATENDLDVRLTFEDLRTAGLPLGSGVVTVFDDTRDLHDVLLRLAHFFADESCGKCYPCQMGTQRQLEVMERYRAGRSLVGDAQRLQDVGWTMTDASLCGLGQTAATAVLSAMRLWPEMFASQEKEE